MTYSFINLHFNSEELIEYYYYIKPKFKNKDIWHLVTEHDSISLSQDNSRKPLGEKTIIFLLYFRLFEIYVFGGLEKTRGRPGLWFKVILQNHFTRTWICGHVVFHFLKYRKTRYKIRSKTHGRIKFYLATCFLTCFPSCFLIF